MNEPTTLDELVIDRSNFRQNRKAYGISQEDVAKKSNLSVGVISNYENFTGQYTQTRTRDDNARIIVRALKDLIQDRIDNMFINGTNKTNNNEKETEKMEEKKMITSDSIVLNNNNSVSDDSFGSDNRSVSLEELVKENKETTEHAPCVNYKRGYNKEKVIQKLRDYCNNNNITFGDFCSMCGINYSTLAPYSVRTAPILSERILLKICEATGWDTDRFEQDRYYDADIVNSIPKTVLDKKETHKIKKVNKANKKVNKEMDKKVNKEDNKQVKTIIENTRPVKDIIDAQVQDMKYTYQDGKFYEEYVVVKHVKRLITMEEFMTAVGQAQAS